MTAMCRLLALGLLLPHLAACGAIFGGTRESIQVNSSPQTATVTTAPGTGTYTTPTTLNLERKNDYTLRFTRDGYRDATFDIQHSLRGGIVALDIIFTGLIGVVVDAATGAWFKLEPKTAIATLERVQDGKGPERIDVAVTVRGNRVAIDAGEPGVAVTIETRP